MISYTDKTFCVNPNCTCGNKLTKDVLEDAEQWMQGATLSIADRCGSMTAEEVKQEFENIINKKGDRDARQG